jgi:hypothetical protein
MPKRKFSSPIQSAEVNSPRRRFTPLQIEGNLESFDPYSRLLDIHELAAVLKLSWRAVFSMKTQRLIPHIRMGRSIRYRLCDVERALEKITVQAAE